MDTSRVGVRQIAVPVEARELCTLSRIDYEDGFLVETNSTQEWTAIEWVRAILEGAPLAIRARLLLGWSAIGLVPNLSMSGRSVLGWEIRTNTPSFVLMGRTSLIGMPGELLFKREKNGLLFATFVRQDNRLAGAVWAATEPQHVPIVHDLLVQASRRLTA
jgi:hypothetical protein